MGIYFWLSIIVVCFWILYKMGTSKYNSSHDLVISRSKEEGLKELEMKKRKSKIQNVAPVNKYSLEWFPVSGAQEVFSPAEGRVIFELNKYDIEWHREVAFKGLQFSRDGYARYDFLLVLPFGFNKHNIHLIEYDGKAYHSSKGQRQRDEIKNKFCLKHGIPLTRYNNKNYYHLDIELAILMKKYGIRLK